MPDNTQAVVVVPVGDKGVMVAAATQRGFTRADQSWFSCLAEKLDVTLSGEMEARGSGRRRVGTGIRRRRAIAKVVP